jgi:Zn ribbon nucleic-acid-binding protein
MEDDKKLQDIQDNTPVPKGINCLSCGKEMKLILKDLHDTYSDNPKMLFMFECKQCNKRRAINEDGSEWKREKPKCPECNEELIIENKYEKDVTTFSEECPKCGYKKVDVDDHKKWKLEHEAKEKRDKALLEKFRDEFCLTEEKGEEMVRLMEIIYRLLKKFMNLRLVNMMTRGLRSL